MLEKGCVRHQRRGEVDSDGAPDEQMVDASPEVCLQTTLDSTKQRDRERTKRTLVTLELRRLRSGSQQRLIVPRMRLRTIGDRSFRVTAARAWNSLPTSVTTATSLASFKRQLKTFLFTKSFPEF